MNDRSYIYSVIILINLFLITININITKINKNICKNIFISSIYYSEDSLIIYVLSYLLIIIHNKDKFMDEVSLNL